MLSNLHNQDKEFATADTLDGKAIANPNLPHKRYISLLNNSRNNRNQKLCAIFKLRKNDQENTLNLCGQKCRTLIALIEEKNKGITALEVSCWAFRLAAYIHILRSEFHLNIITKNEPHDGGFHARYYLLDEVEILEVLND